MQTCVMKSFTDQKIHRVMEEIAFVTLKACGQRSGRRATFGRVRTSTTRTQKPHKTTSLMQGTTRHDTTYLANVIYAQTPSNRLLSALESARSIEHFRARNVHQGARKHCVCRASHHGWPWNIVSSAKASRGLFW